MTSSTILSNALRIPDVSPAEAEVLAQTELLRLLALLESLDEEDWQKPTACTEWNVRDMLAHQAGAYASGAGYAELIHQYLAVLKPGQLAEDAINKRQSAPVTSSKRSGPSETSRCCIKIPPSFQRDRPGS